MRCKGVFALAALQLPLARGSQCERFHPTDALLVIDVQNCFIDERPVRSETPASPLLAEWTTTIPAGSLQVPGAAGIVDVINEWVDFASSGQVYATLDYHPPGHCSFCHTQVGDGIVPGTYCITGTASSPLVFSEDFNASHRCRDPISELDWLAAKYFQFPAHCVAGTPGARLDPYLRLGANATVVKLGLEPTRDDYSVFNGGRVSVAPAGTHDRQPSTHDLLAPATADALGETLVARGVKRLFVVGLAVDFIVGRSVQHALEAESNWTVALVAPAARALYSADAVFDAVSRAPNGRLLQDTRLEHSTSHAAAMRELCGGTCDVPSYLSDCPHASDRPCAEEPCEQQFCAPLPDRAWGECTECDCAQFGVCNGDGSCTYVCEWPTHGPGCEEGWELELVIACVVACAVLLVVAAGGAWAFRAVRRSRERLNALRIVGSKELPGVGFGGEGHEYHIFLSHVWSSGQDQVAVIRRRLAELLPTVRCFLDIEDLEDISRLEEHVAASTSVLIFLSKGYFLSRNCMREVRAAIAFKKPIILVHEQRADHGGAPLAAIIAECPPEEREAVFGAAGPSGPRPVITWLRLNAFQTESLARVAETFLLSTPRYQHLSSKGLPLYVPGSLRSFDLELPRPVVLYVSPLNPGALPVARELVACGTATGGTGQSSQSFVGAPIALSGAASAAFQAEIEAEVPSGPQESSLRFGAAATPARTASRRRASLGLNLGPQRRASLGLNLGPVGRSKTRRGSTPGHVTKQLSDLAVKAAERLRDASSEQAAAEAAEVAAVRARERIVESGVPTHMLLVLNDQSFVGAVGDGLAREVRAARATGLPVVMVHQNDADCGGCDFDRFFSVTPDDLIRGGLYRDALAVPWYPGPHLPVSCSTFALSVGAVQVEPSPRRGKNKGRGTSTEAPPDRATAPEESTLSPLGGTDRL